MRLVLVLCLLVSCRLFFASDTLQHDHQLSSPLTSYSRLQEGIYLLKNDIDPYSGGSFYHSPLFLSVFTTILPASRTVSHLIWTLCDGVGAWALVRIWRARQGMRSSSRDALIAAMYLVNPYLFLPNLALSTSSFENALQLLSLSFACQGQTSASLLAFAILTQLSLSSVLLLPPIVLLIMSSPQSHLSNPKPFSSYSNRNLKSAAALFCEFAVYEVILCFASTMVTGNWNWIGRTWGVGLTLPDLTPNPGLWWYFFTEMFDHFRPFFLMVFSAHLIIYVAPICIKFQHDPLFACFLLLGVLGIFKPYLTLADPGLFLSMIALFPEIYPHFRHPIVTTLLHLHSALLLPLFHHLWLEQGTGNANFFYASTLVFGLANGAALVDSIYAGLRVAIGETKKDAVWAVVQE